MNSTNLRHRVLGLLGAMAMAAGFSGCDVPRADDINRVQPGFVEKSMFLGDEAWHYRRTVADSETQNGVIIEGSGDIFIDRVVFEVQEDLLIARKPYGAIPGAGLDALPGGAEDFDGAILAAWPITSHFDIIRGYDALTGRENNLIVENTTDRPWFEREYMRVDFANNIVEGSFLGSFSFGWSPVQFNSTGSFWTNLETNPTDVYASRFSDGYIEITDRVFLGQDLFTCFGFSGQSVMFLFQNCGFGEAKIRHSFKRIDEENDYEPRFYPDSFIRKGPDGEPLLNDETNEVEREEIYGRFGIFRLTTPTYDRQYGFTEDGREWRAMLFDIWEDTRDENGMLIPPSERQEKPIIYYLNAEYPARYREVASQIEADYNRVFKSMIASLKGVEIDQVMDMFEIRDNDCNEANIIATVQQNPRLVSAVERAVCGDGEICGFPREGEGLTSALEARIGIGNLKTVCTSLEAATKDPVTGRSAFDWQRIGDVRHNMMVWLNNPQRSGWGGYGPMHADAITGETISATSYIRGVYYEIGAANVSDYICFMNDEEGCGPTDIIYGKDVRRQIGRVEDRVIEMATQEPSTAAVQELTRRLEALGATTSGQLPRDETRSTLQNRLKRLEGTELESYLMNDTVKVMLSNGSWKPWLNSDEEAEGFDNLHEFVELSDPFSPRRMEQRKILAAGGYCFLENDLDPHWAGLALDLKDMTREERYQAIAHRLIKHVLLHELGHNVGLAHNFEGSYDALNYDMRFWENVQGTPEQQLQANLDEYRHTSVMEYMSSKGLFADFLGKYDEAAIRFAYGNQIETFASDAFQAEGGDALRAWRYYSDYRAIPDHLCGGSCPDEATRMDVLSNREWVQFDPQTPNPREVPYLFCDNRFDRLTPFCATFDYGSSLTEIQANYYNTWKNYFYFNNFARGRLSPYGWSIGSAFLPIRLVMDFFDTTNQYFQLMTATDPEFQGSDLQSDMAGVLFQSMNIATEILAVPTPGRRCPSNSPAFDDAGRQIYLNWGFTEGCDPDLPLNDPQIQNLAGIDVNMGDGRPAFLAFTREYEEQDLWMIGSFFDKQSVAIQLGLSRPRLFRFNYQLDRRNFFLSPYRIFEPEMLELYGNMFTLDGFITLQVAENLASFWCTDPAFPDRPDRGYMEPRRMFDMGATEFSAFPDATSGCLNAAWVYPTFTTNLPEWALIAGHAILSSDIDARLDMGKLLKIWAIGAYDEPSYLTTDNFPLCAESTEAEDCLCAYADPTTGVEYRALNRVRDGEESIACELIDNAVDAEANYEGTQADIRAFDRWREAVERLEYNRTLYRIFQDR